MYKHSKLYYFDTKMVVINIYRYDDLNMIKWHIYVYDYFAKCNRGRISWQFCQFIRCYKYVVYKEANKMTEEFNESMINNIKKVTKSLARYNKLKTSKLLFISTVVNLMGLFLLVNYLRIILIAQVKL